MSKIALVLAVALLSPLGFASPKNEEAEIGRLHKRAQAMFREAKELQATGKHDWAHKMKREAQELEAQWVERSLHFMLKEAERHQEAGRHEKAQKLRAHAEDFASKHGRHRGHREHRDELHGILEGLEHGIVALEMLGMREEVAHLKRIADGVRERMRHRDANRKEIEIAEHRLEVMRLAFTALREAEKRDAAELMEHAIHALELGIEGRNDPEARKIKDSAPKLGAQVELLLLAGKLWNEFGHEKKAAICTKLGRELQEIWRRKQRGKAEGGERTAKRVEQLEERMKRIERALKEIEGLLREQRRD